MFKFLPTLFFIFLLSISSNAYAIKISDIQIEGLQRLEPGLVFNNIPFEINDEIEAVDFSKTISLLYATGQFKDIVVERKGSVIIIAVREKPILFELNFSGTTIFQPEALASALNQMNIASGLVVDEGDIKTAEKEITNQYLSNGKYSAEVTSEIVPLSNNRVNVNFYINEGRISRIKEIKIFGNKIFSNEDLLDEMALKTTNLMSWWNKDDRYSKQTLSGDLEAIKSFYMDRGYLDFKTNSTLVSISKSKKDVFISITVDEGKKYTIGDVSISGNIPEPIPTEDLRTKVLIKKGDTFSRKLVNQSAKNISNLLGNYGYAFSNINSLPNINSDNLVVDFNFNVDPGKKIYVRRINLIGNESTKDEVVRRELRQYESAWFAQDKVDLSVTRLNRTQFFESVNVETPTVQGNSDQVDLNIIMKETNTGKFSIGAGVSSSDGVVGTLGLQQANFMGTGNLVKTEISTGGVNKVWGLTFLDPYWTDDGVSRGFNLYYRDIDTKKLDTGDYKSNNYGLGLDFGIPLDEFKTFKVGSTFDFTELDLKSNSPQGYKDFCSDIASSGSLNCDAHSLLFYLKWQNNSLNNAFFATEGSKITLSADITTPGLDLEYFKIKIDAEKYFPLSESVTTKIKGSLGYADNYGDNLYPFFKNFTVGGKTSVRGYKEGSIGKKTYDSSSSSFVTYGGKQMISFGAETFFPVPFVKKTEAYRMSAFIEGGGAFDNSFDADEMRYSVGLGALWISPFGPLNISIGVPLNEETNDLTEKFQFGMGSSF